jgi:hypothetical protein
LNTVFKQPVNSYIELTNYRKYVPMILFQMSELIDEIDTVKEYCEREKTDGKSSGKYHKKWSKEEDEWLIEAVCDDVSLMRIAIALGRTVSAVQGRITYLVGVKRLSQQVAGKFIGTANGAEFEADLVGTVFKTER